MYQALPIGVEVGLLLEDLLAALDPDQNRYTTHDIIAALPHSKLSYLGNGAFGVAASAYLSDGREIVLKLTGNGEDGYPWWAEYCKDNPSKHLPEVYHTARVGAIHVTAMKRYEPMSQDQEGIVRSIYGEGAYKDPSLAEAVARVRFTILELQGAVDMHLGNYMSDPETGEVVITDPCSFMPPAGGPVIAPRQLAMNFEIDNMGTAIYSLLCALRKAEERGEEQPDIGAGKLDKGMLRWNLPKDSRLLIAERWSMPKDRLIGMDFAGIEARVGQQYRAVINKQIGKLVDIKQDEEFMKFIRNKWG